MVRTYPDRKELYLFPLPEFCLFMGYTLILTIDKVFFDAHGLLGKSQSKPQDGEIEGEDPAAMRFINEVT